ncbi:MAG: hypothetical protein K9N46_13635 [Candidatus Marinimicrobia bacterium]|nr:hypothetical protein [Candidatus Neomarinimicrobiota bacterium]MCF7829798.1 hypothetical protein [Candidatus Neomarinimicrobiota bacterium]MCF7881769.1 hypothetical protein [Candidatus Neomarinimicrobiota bacterium]
MRLHNSLHIKRITTLLLAIGVLLVMTSCDDGSKPDYLSEPAPNVENLLQSGWENYISGDYNTAYDNFFQASERDASVPQIYLGLAYVSLQVGDLEQAVSNFQKTIAYAIFDPDNADMLTYSSNAGLAITYLAMKRYENSVNSATTVIDNAPDFEFHFDNSVTIDDIYLVRALGSFHMKDFEQAYYDVLSVDSNADFSSVVSEETVNDATIRSNTRDLPNGTAQFELQGKDLVTVQSVELTENGTTRSYEIIDFVQGGTTTTIFGNPLPAADQALDVSYVHAPDYGKFLDTLMGEVVRLREENH